nr:DUF389 domain-containing protein [Herbiconiux sp.]
MDGSINTTEAMRDAVIFDGPARGRQVNRFWVLLSLAAVIASAGVAADSTATVIGAMIVAPMMLPIQGAMLSTVLGDRTNLIRSVVLIVLGATACVVIGFLVGLLMTNDITAATNTQVAGRVSPRLIDLLAALGTGVVGSIALVRRDISDTLPGVAIAISLVPPLTVAGLALESGATGESLGALLLFATNVAAILVTGIVVMAFYRVHPDTVRADAKPVDRRRAFVVIVSMLVIVGIPLTVSSVSSASSALRDSTIHTVAERWADEVGWDLVDVDDTHVGSVVIRVTGPLPVPETTTLKEQLAAEGIDLTDLEVELVPSYVVDLGTP